MACIANPIAVEVAVVRRDTSSTYKKVRRGEEALKVAGPSLNEEFLEGLLRDLWQLVKDTKTFISFLNSGILDGAPDELLRKLRSDLGNITEKSATIRNGCRRIKLDTQPTFASALKEIERTSDRLESLMEGIDLSLQPAFHSAVDSAAQALEGALASERS